MEGTFVFPKVMKRLTQEKPGAQRPCLIVLYKGGWVRDSEAKDGR